MNFNLSMHQKETSAHFLNFTPVINYVYNNRIGVIDTKNNYFIGKVFEFYKNSCPQIKNFKDTARVNYDYKFKNTGFEIK